MLEIINRYTHGYVGIPVIVACQEKGFFDLLPRQGSMSLTQIADHLAANSGHLQAALRLLHSLHWLSQDTSGAYSLTVEAEIHRQIPDDIIDLFHLPIESYLAQNQQRGQLSRWIDRSHQGWQVSNALIRDFLDGILVLPILLGLKQHLDYTQTPLFSTLSSTVREELYALFVNKEWAHQENGQMSLTDMGQFMLEHALIAGITVSYKPMLSRLPELLFGSHYAVFQKGDWGRETHIDRSLNVLASGYQHDKYFAEVDEMIVAIFNGVPIEEQPKYVADMGCGDGSLLKRIYETIRFKSARGAVLDQYPVIMLGVDYNQEALDATARTLSDIPHQILHGDIANPEQMIAELVHQGISDPENILHVRSFLDHELVYVPPTHLSKVRDHSRLSYHGVYVDSNGQWISPEAIVQCLTEHLKCWATVIGKPGLIILEVHSLEPEMVYAFLGQSDNLHFDAYHAFSMQYLVEADVFVMAAAEAGLFAKAGFSKYHPKTFPFTRITLNWFEKRAYTVRHAHPKDLPALLELEQACWAEPLQVSSEVILHRLERFPEGQCVLEMENRIIGVVYSQRISSHHVLENATFAKLPSLHTPTGAVIQLITINILPDMQHLGLGDQLLEFMLQYCSVKTGIESVAGVTRCKNYVLQAEMPLEVYIQQRDEPGHYIDPILQFHHAHGAKIKGIVPGYRIEDSDNQGNGVLIEYDIHHRQRFSAQAEKTDIPSSNRSKTDIAKMIEESILSILGNTRVTAYSPTRSLAEMGLDSMDLLELQMLLRRRIGVKIPYAYFFQDNSLETITRYFQEQTN
jgi:acyl carrier protein/GNAT superfamily N-acetyltransferase/SAM-dependent methyltransferase